MTLEGTSQSENDKGKKIKDKGKNKQEITSDSESDGERKMDYIKMLAEERKVIRERNPDGLEPEEQIKRDKDSRIERENRVNKCFEIFERYRDGDNTNDKLSIKALIDKIESKEIKGAFDREYTKLSERKEFKSLFSDPDLFANSAKNPGVRERIRIGDKNNSEVILRKAVDEMAKLYQNILLRLGTERIDKLEGKIVRLREKIKEGNAEQQQLQEKNALLQQEVSQLREAMKPKGEKELSEHLRQLGDRLIKEEYLPFFRSFDKKVRSILVQLPWFEGPDGRLTKEIERLGLDKEKREELGFTEDFMDIMRRFEKEADIANLRIPEKIERIEDSRRSLEGKESLAEQEDKMLEWYSTYLEYLTLLQETLHEQYEELGKKVGEYRSQKKLLPTLEKELRKANQECLTFFKERPRRSIEGSLLREAMKRYEDELDPNVVSPLRLHRANALVEQASETFFNGKRRIMLELRKRAAKYLDLEDYDDRFFLKSQRHETDYYIRHPNLEILKQKRGTCGETSTRMMLADKNKRYLEDRAEEELNDKYKRFPITGKGTYVIMHPIILKEENHPIEYEYMWDDTVCHDDYSEYFEEYRSSMDSTPRKITVEQFKSAISQKGEEEPILVSLRRIYEGIDPGSVESYRHIILIDAMDSEGRIVCRNPGRGKGYAVYWDEFLDVWRGEACIPVGVVPHDDSSSIPGNQRSGDHSSVGVVPHDDDSSSTHASD